MKVEQGRRKLRLRIEKILFVRLILFFVQLACAVRTNAPISTPTTPDHIADLPAEARVSCEGNFVLFAHAEREPMDKSGDIGDRGGEVGRVSGCAMVTVREIEWSSFTNEYWALIEYDGGEGWISTEYLIFSE